MKLEVNNSGAWKRVLDFGIEHIERVKLTCADLAAISAAASANDKPVAWRIVDATETPVLMTDKQCAWFAPHWMLGREIVP